MGNGLFDVVDTASKMLIDRDFVLEIDLQGGAQGGGRWQGGGRQGFDLGHLFLGVAHHEQGELLSHDIALAGQDLLWGKRLAHDP